MSLVFEANPYRRFCGILEFSNTPKEFFSTCEVAASIAKELLSENRILSESVKFFSCSGKILVFPHLFHELGALVSSISEWSHHGASSLLASILSISYDAIQLLNLYSQVYLVDPISLGLPFLNGIKAVIVLSSCIVELRKERDSLSKIELGLNSVQHTILINSNCSKTHYILPEALAAKEDFASSFKTFVEYDRNYKVSSIANKISIAGLCSLSLLGTALMLPAAPVIQGALATSYLASTLSKNYYKYFCEKQVELYQSKDIIVKSISCNNR